MHIGTRICSPRRPPGTTFVPGGGPSGNNICSRRRPPGTRFRSRRRPPGTRFRSRRRPPATKLRSGTTDSHFDATDLKVSIYSVGKPRGNSHRQGRCVVRIVFLICNLRFSGGSQEEMSIRFGPNKKFIFIFAGDKQKPFLL